jgi:hypothetical protein
MGEADCDPVGSSFSPYIQGRVAARLSDLVLIAVVPGWSFGQDENFNRLNANHAFTHSSLCQNLIRGPRNESSSVQFLTQPQYQGLWMAVYYYLPR